MQVGRLAARAMIGSLFIGHGTQKLYGWFAGPGIAGTEGMMEALEMRPARANAYAAGVTETTGGALVLAGLGTPLAAASLIGTMVVAIRKVHLANGPWAANGGWEYNAVLIAAMAALAEAGPGPLSVDARRLPDFHGSAFALAALGAGVAGSYLGTHPALNPPGQAPLEGEGAVAGDPATAHAT